MPSINVAVYLNEQEYDKYNKNRKKYNNAAREAFLKEVRGNDEG